MIIGEHNLIIGKINSIISDFSISIFVYIINKICFVYNYINVSKVKINPKSNSPPFISLF